MEKQDKIQKSIEIFEKYGIKTRLDKNGQIIISHYHQPKGTTFSKLGIDEDELIENVVACEGAFDTLHSSLTTFPLVVSQEIKLYDDTKITEMPELKATGSLVANKTLKKLPKLKAVGMILIEDSQIKSLPKLKDAGIFIAKNSALCNLPSLEQVTKLCIIDCPITDLKELKSGKDIFICSTNAQEPVKINSLPSLDEIEKLFVANSTIKTLPKLKKAEKLAFYNCLIKNIKLSVCKNTEISTQLDDEQLSEKFDTFTDWYNSDVLNSSITMLGNVVNMIKS